MILERSVLFVINVGMQINIAQENPGCFASRHFASNGGTFRQS